MTSGIYSLKCLTTGQYYVGTAIDWRKRTNSHLRKLENGVHKNKSLQMAWNTHGAADFEIKLLEACPIPMLLVREKFWVDKLDSIRNGFNSQWLGSNGYLTHGQTHSLAFRSWESMKQRCLNPKSPDYHRYGAKGVTICDRWRNSFENFLADMGERPEGTSLDRYPNKHGNYEPNNCRWATPSEQQRNLRNNLYLTYGGETKLVINWAAEKGIPVGILRQRVQRGWSGPELFSPTYTSFEGEKLPDGTMPIRLRNETRDIKKYTAHGKTLTLTEWAVELGIDRRTIAQRIEKYKIPPEEALNAEPRKRGKSGPRRDLRDTRNCITAFGQTKILTEWAEEYKIPLSTLRNRIFRANMHPEAALTAPLYAQQQALRTKRN